MGLYVHSSWDQTHVTEAARACDADVEMSDMDYTPIKTAPMVPKIDVGQDLFQKPSVLDSAV